MRKYAYILFIFILIVPLSLWLINAAVSHQVRRSLEDAQSFTQPYKITVGEITTSLIKGSVSMKNITVYREGCETKFPSFKVKSVHYKLAIADILKGRWSANAELSEPKLSLPAGKLKTTEEAQWSSLLDRLIMKSIQLPINEIRVKNGLLQLNFNDQGNHRQLDLTDVELVLKGLSAKASLLDRFPSVAIGTGNALRSRVSFHFQFNAHKPFSDYSLQAEIRDLDLEAASPFLAMGGFFFKPKGRFSLYTEAYGYEDKFSGFVSPFFEDIILAGADNDHPKERVPLALCAYRQLRQIPLKGTIRPDEWYYWNAVIFTIHSALMEGLAPVVRLNHSKEKQQSKRPPERKTSRGREQINFPES